MPADTAHGYPYMLASDALAGVAGHIQNLAQEIDDRLQAPNANVYRVATQAANTPVSWTHGSMDGFHLATTTNADDTLVYDGTVDRWFTIWAGTTWDVDTTSRGLSLIHRRAGATIDSDEGGLRGSFAATPQISSVKASMTLLTILSPGDGIMLTPTSSAANPHLPRLRMIGHGI